MTNQFSALSRRNHLERMSMEQYDVLVIGGGITGAGIALDAALRGMKVALVDMQDFAGGTSSRSTKLVHGGLRYLKQFQFALVAEVGRERGIVYENGPHVTTPEWMLLPIYQDGPLGKVSTALGLRLYDRLAGVKKTEQMKMLTAEETLAMEPLLKKEGLLGGGKYIEYRTDDARLTVEVLKAAVANGATAVNYVKVVSFIYRNHKIRGARVLDLISKKRYEIRAKKIVNATGPWVDEVCKLDVSKKKKHLRLTKGVHIVFDRSIFPLRHGVYFHTPDGRMVFAIPRDGKTYVGTTDTFYFEDPANPIALREDRKYLLDAVRFMFPDLKIGEAVIESSWAGVRPLIYQEGKQPAEISRKDEIWEGETGLITIAGGKLTGFRKMAESVVDLLVRRLQEKGKRYKSCQTKCFPISGGEVGGSQGFPAFLAIKEKEAVNYGFTEEEGYELGRMYGSNVDELFRYGQQYEKERDISLPRILYARVMYAIEQEMAVKPVDFFIRRTGSMFFNIHWVYQWKDQVISLMAKKLNWTMKEIHEYKAELEQSLHEAEAG